MRVLVLGGTGFIGSAIVRRLRESGYEVTTFHRRGGADAIAGDRNRLDDSTEDFKRLRPDVVVDVIAYTERQAKSLFDVFRGIVGRVVVLSSGDVYRAYDVFHGRVSGPIEFTPLTESSPLRERMYPYSGTQAPPDSSFHADEYDKILVERAVLGCEDLPATVLRLPMVYGPGDVEGVKRRFYAYLKRMDDGRPAILLNRGNSAWRAPWGYTEDVAEAVRLCVENERAAGEIYNVGEPGGSDLLDWIRELAAVSGWRGEIVTVNEPCPPPNLPQNLRLEQNLNMDTAKIRRELGYRETVSRRESLRRTIDWEREHPPRRIDPTQFDYQAEDEILERGKQSSSGVSYPMS